MITRTRLILLVVLAVLIAGLVVYPKLEAATQPTAPAVAHSAGQDPAKQAGRRAGGGSAGPVAVVSAVAAREDVPVTKDAVGFVEPIATVALRPRMDGVIVEQDVQEGALVKPGDVLFRLDDRALQATVAKDEAAIAKDQANLDQANADLKRDKSLVGRQDVVTQQQLEQQQALAKSDEATVAMDKAVLQADQVQLTYATITAPIAGRVGAVNQTTGNLVHTSDQNPLLTITQMAPVRVSYAVPEGDLETYRKALRSGNEVPVQAFTDGSKKPLATGKLTFLDSSVDNASGTVTVKAEFANDDQALWPGGFVTARTQLEVVKDATVVPVAAAQQNDKGAFVYLVKPDQTVAIQPVTISQTKDDHAVIASGVQPGDHVVIEGQLRLANGARVAEKVSPPEHVASAAP